MKESRFIELLNLYVDQQLDAADAAELEAEMQRNPARRQTYREYCRMQKACTLLFEKEREGAPAHTALARALADANRKIVSFPPVVRPLWLRPGIYAGGLAAMAACVAFVVVTRQTPQASPGAPSQVTSVPTAGPAAVAVAVAAAPAETTASAQPVIIPAADKAVAARPAYFSVLPPKRTLFATSNVQAVRFQTGEATPANFEWMSRVDLRPMRREELPLLTHDAKFRSGQPVSPETVTDPLAQPASFENTAFQFQR